MDTILASFKHEDGDIQLTNIDLQEQFVTIRFNGSTYDIRFTIDSDDDCLKLTHNEGFCASTSEFTIAYPDNEDYKSDDRLNEVLNFTYDQINKH